MKESAVNRYIYGWSFDSLQNIWEPCLTYQNQVFDVLENNIANPKNQPDKGGGGEGGRVQRTIAKN